MVANKTKIVRIGNSQGVRIPRNILEQAGFISDEPGSVYGQEVELEVGQEGILIRHARHSRAGWAEQLQQMAECGDDTLLDVEGASHSSSWDERGWVW